MKSTELAQTDQNLALRPIQPPSTSLFRLIYKAIHCLMRWLLLEKLEIAPPTAARCTRMPRLNRTAIEIIKRFEGFPPDVEPDLRATEAAVRRLVQVPLTSNQLSALVSFTYNVGEARLRQSALLKYLNAGRYRAAARQFDLWVYIGSHRSAKLMARRVAETGLFLKAEDS